MQVPPLLPQSSDGPLGSTTFVQWDGGASWGSHVNFLEAAAMFVLPTKSRDL